MSAMIAPEPSAAEREAILAALGASGETVLGEWAEAALAEGVAAGVDSDEPDP
jgi:hypothetical protein